MIDMRVGKHHEIKLGDPLARQELYKRGIGCSPHAAVDEHSTASSIRQWREGDQNRVALANVDECDLDLRCRRLGDTAERDHDQNNKNVSVDHGYPPCESNIDRISIVIVAVYCANRLSDH